MLNSQKKKKKKKEQKQSAKIWNFTILLTTLLETPPHEYTWILGSKSGGLFQRRCHLQLLPPYGPILTKTKKIGKNKKIQISQFFEQLW